MRSAGDNPCGLRMRGVDDGMLAMLGLDDRDRFGAVGRQRQESMKCMRCSRCLTRSFVGSRLMRISSSVVV